MYENDGQADNEILLHFEWRAEEKKWMRNFCTDKTASAATGEQSVEEVQNFEHPFSYSQPTVAPFISLLFFLIGHRRPASINRSIIMLETWAKWLCQRAQRIAQIFACICNKIYKFKYSTPDTNIHTYNLTSLQCFYNFCVNEFYGAPFNDLQQKYQHTQNIQHSAIKWQIKKKWLYLLFGVCMRSIHLVD